MNSVHSETPQKKYDTIVIGTCGAIGSATTYQLAKEGADILGIDRFVPRHAMGSSHGQSRIQRIFSAEHPLYTDTSRRSIDILQELERNPIIKRGLLKNRDVFQQALFQQTGVLSIGNPNSTNAFGNIAQGFHRQTIDVAKDHIEGEDYKILNAQDLRDRYPQFVIRDCDTGCMDIKAGMTYPERIIDAQITLAKEHGAHLLFDTKVTKIHPDGRYVTVKTEDGQEFQSESVVLAVGAWTKHFLGEYQHLFKVCRQILHWFTVNNSKDFDPTNGCPTFIRQLPDGDTFYGFPEIDGTVKIPRNNYNEDTSDMDLINRTVDAQEIETFRNLISPWISSIREHVRAATCAYTLYKHDPHAVLGEDPRYPGKVYFGGPGAGHSFKHSPAFGQALMQMIKNGRSEIDVSPLSPNRLIEGVRTLTKPKTIVK
jgi:sarcosine oxidase